MATFFGSSGSPGERIATVEQTPQPAKMEIVYAWGPLNTDSAYAETFLGVGLTLETALTKGHLEWGLSRQGFSLYSVEISALAWACWPANGRRFACTYQSGNVRQAIDAMYGSIGTIWIRKFSWYRMDPIGEAVRDKHSRYYSLCFDGQVGTAVIEPPKNPVITRFYRM